MTDIKYTDQGSGLVGAQKCLEIIFPDAKTRPCLRTFQKLSRDRKIPFKRIGRLIFYDPSEVRMYIDLLFGEKADADVPERHLLSLIDNELFFRKGEEPPPEWKGNATELVQTLCSEASKTRESARRLLTVPAICSQLLARLRDKIPDRFISMRTASGVQWIIKSRNASIGDFAGKSAKPQERGKRK